MKRPSSLYKYVPTDRMDILTEVVIRFTQPQVFNDPFESLPSLKTFPPAVEIEAMLERIFDNDIAKGGNFVRELYDKIVPDSLRTHVSLQQFTKNLDQVHPKLREEIVAKSAESLDRLNRGEFFPPDDLPPYIGILSLAEKRDNLLMWAHYARSHEGLAIEFDLSDGFFYNGPLAKVKYSHKRPSLNSIDDYEKPESLERILVTKSVCWEYEKEWRYFLPLSKAQKRIPCKNDYSIYLFALPPSAIKSLVLGCRMADSMESEVRRILEAKAEFSHIKIFKARLHSKVFRLEISA
jgi:hypothetical protein